MTKTKTEFAATTQAPEPKPSIQERLQRELSKDRGQKIKVCPLWNNNYRVNWYIPLDFGTNGSGKIVKSRFLKVTETDGKLNIEDNS